MKEDFGTRLVSTIDRLIGQVSPLATLVDGIVDRIAPKATAQAGRYCFSGSWEYCVKEGCPGEKYREYVHHGIDQYGAPCVEYGPCVYC